MISFVKGELCEIRENCIVVEVNGLGYEIFTPMTTMDRLPSVGSQVKVFTYLHVREDAIQMYGFLNQDDLYVFKLLITVNGIGPKGALGILSVISTNELRFAVLSEDVKAISKAPGIGAKTAGKLILELKDKLKLEDAFEQRYEATTAVQETMFDHSSLRNEAIQALIALGYSNTEATKAVRKVPVREGMSVEDILKSSLKNISL